MIENEYRDRNILLKKMGYNSYAEYLKSDLWLSIRHACFIKGKGKCSLCIEPATTVHHLVYTEKVMKGETIDGLVLVCNLCHYKVEFDINKVKRDIHDARDVYYKLRKAGKNPVKKLCPTCKQRKEWGGCHIWCKKLANPEYVPTIKDEEREGIFRCSCGRKRNKYRWCCHKCGKAKFGAKWKGRCRIRSK